MSLLEAPVLIIDCQTTGMRPSNGEILEIGWCLASPHNSNPKIYSTILKCEEVPNKIREITGINDDDLKGAVDSQLFFEEWQKVRNGLPANGLVVSHYAQFEKSFFQSWYEKHGSSLDMEFLCSQRIAKKLFPEIPSANLRGIAGFLSVQVGSLKRAKCHVEATLVVWKAIAQKLFDMGIYDVDALKVWLKEKSKPSSNVRYEYKMDRLARLALPNKPGVYRMLAKDNRILYVGKATSLKSRVNSYFRGQKGRDRRKLELMAQVWDLQVTECETPLEAALLETDEIKKWDPPYNVSLKTSDRRLIFYSHDFSDFSESQDREFPLGPFRPGGILESLRDLHAWRHEGQLGLIFYQEIEPRTMEEGFQIFCANNCLDSGSFSKLSMRGLLAYACRELRHFLKQHDGRDMEEVFREEKEASGEMEAEELTAAMVAEKFKRLFLRSALALKRCRQLTRIRNAKVIIPTKQGERELIVRNGYIGLQTKKVGDRRFPWADSDIADYDRMSILLSETSRRRYSIVYGAEVL